MTRSRRLVRPLFLAALVLAAVAALAAAPRAAGPLDGRERRLLSAGPDQDGRLRLNADTSFRWTGREGARRWERLGVWQDDVAGSPRALRLSYRERSAGPVPGRQGELIVWWAWDETFDLLLLWTEDGIVGLFSGDPELFLYRGRYRAGFGPGESPTDQPGSQPGDQPGDQPAIGAAANLGDWRFGGHFWAEGQPGSGVGARIHADLDLPGAAEGRPAPDPALAAPALVILMNGVAMNPGLYMRCARLREVSLATSGHASLQANLLDSPEPRFIALSSRAGDHQLDLVATAIWPGVKTEALCVSKLLVIGRIR